MLTATQASWHEPAYMTSQVQLHGVLMLPSGAHWNHWVHNSRPCPALYLLRGRFT